MLQRLLNAAVTLPEQEGKLHAVLDQFVARLDAQAGVLARVREGLRQVGAAVETGGSGKAG